MQRIHQRESGPSCLMPYGCDWDALVLPITTRSLPVLADWASTCSAAFGMPFLNYQFDRRIWYAVRRPSLTAPRLDGSSLPTPDTRSRFGGGSSGNQLRGRVWHAQSLSERAVAAQQREPNVVLCHTDIGGESRTRATLRLSGRLLSPNRVACVLNR